MLGSTFNLIDFIFGLTALIVAITIHEFSHALAAEHLGDPTPRLQGRLTLNPLAHLDPLGTIMLLLVRFGWGKPVVFDPYNLRHPRRDGAIISLAGPTANIILAVACSILLQILFRNITGIVFMLVASFLEQLIVLNIVLAVFNLVPIHPLDGFKIVEGILPEEAAHEWHQLEPYGLIFLLVLILPIFGGIAPISRLISPVINFMLSLLLPGVPSL